MSMSAERIAQILLEIEAIGVNADKPIQFKSGIQSPVYMDNRSLPFHPPQWKEVIAAFQGYLQNLPLDVIAGIEAAGIPHSAALGYAMNKPSVFVRKAAKEHGKQKRVEGGNVAGLRVVLVEDLVTTGGSSLSGVEALRTEGAIVEHCIAIVSYGFAEAAENFARANVELHTLTNFDTIWRFLKPTVSAEVAQMVETWHADPYTWGKTDEYSK
ncbi:MAG: orotate phosphoribosyltransferase [Chloroflexota bacterium]|nr:orotate phosphoribosyltransferase [Chloroflexota bacterium]NOG64184.1 orotate phosphoribosyltransferase [Chloroflexota bacterium]GIK65760.1 MAG: orotate phosphoribosyltransferase [Chloroflexota bacterium]